MTGSQGVEAAGTAILGAGLAGLAAGSRLTERGASATIYERAEVVGGHAASYERAGFTFDEGPHVSFTDDEEMRKVFAQLSNGLFAEKTAVVRNLWRGHWLPHPAQFHLWGLPSETVVPCIADRFRAEHGPEEARSEDYSQWCRRAFGEAFARDFVFPYTRKYWATEPEALDVSWIGPRIRRPSAEEMLRGALAPRPESNHYISTFRYPSHGGFGAYATGLAKGLAVRVGHELVEANFSKKLLVFADGKQVRYQNLISSLPLPDLIRMSVDAPAAVRLAAEGLHCTSLVLVDVALREPLHVTKAHWFYVYDEDVIFSRCSQPGLMAAANVPDGRGSVQVEVYSSHEKPLTVSDVLTRAIDDLVRSGIVSSEKDIEFAFERRVRYANVMFDHQRVRNLATVNSFLASAGVTTCGRYGEWAYHWSDDAVRSGWNAADRLLAGHV